MIIMRELNKITFNFQSEKKTMEDVNTFFAVVKGEFQEMERRLQPTESIVDSPEFEIGFLLIQTEEDYKLIVIQPNA